MGWIVRWLALASLTSAALGCDDGPSTPAPGNCDLIVSDVDDCPAAEVLCDGVCGATHECCYPMGDRWGTVYTDCLWCHDAGPDAATAAGLDASAPAHCDRVVATQELCVLGPNLCETWCGAHTCCYSTDAGWGVTLADCPSCSDAGVDAP